MRRKRLAPAATKVTDLTPLRGMKLTGLYLDRTRVKDLSPLEGMPLKGNNLEGLVFTPATITTGSSIH